MNLAWIFLLSFAWCLPERERLRTTKRSNWLTAFDVVVAVVAIVVVGRWFPDDAFQHPAFVIPLWVAITIDLYRRWHSQRGSFPPNTDAKAA